MARASWLMLSHKLAWLVNDPGYPQEYDPIQETPFECSDRKGGGAATAAVDFAAAHACWGWGAQIPVASDTGAASAATLRVEDVKDLEALVQYRSQFARLPVQQRPQ